MELRTQKILMGTLGILLSAVVGFAGWREHELSETHRKGKELLSLPRPLTEKEKKGQVIYHERQCAVCHGINGIGGVSNFNAQTGAKINGLRKLAEGFTRQEVKDKIMKGVAKVDPKDPMLPMPPLTMPPYKNSLLPEELEVLVDFLWALTPPPKANDPNAF